MEQPILNYTSNDLDRVIARDFPASEVEQVRALLSIYGRESWHREVLRVQMACLKNAAGGLDNLRQQVETANVDYRDVLAAAEYRRYGRARNDAEKAQAIADDWRELQDWLART